MNCNSVAKMMISKIEYLIEILFGLHLQDANNSRNCLSRLQWESILFVRWCVSIIRPETYKEEIMFS